MSTEINRFDRLKQVNTKDELTVAGYIRKQSSINIPYEIIQLCILFFVHFEKWSKIYHGNGIQISDSIARRVFNETHLESALGELVIKSGGIHHWRFKLLKINGTKANWKIAIGVVQVKGTNEISLKRHTQSYLTKKQYTFDNTDIKSYVYVVCRKNRCSSNGVPFNKTKMPLYDRDDDYLHKYGKENDIVDMYLDLKDKTISYAINDEYLGIGDRDVMDTEYRMGVSISGTGTEIELLSYHELHEMPVFERTFKSND